MRHLLAAAGYKNGEAEGGAWATGEHLPLCSPNPLTNWGHKELWAQSFQTI